MRAEFSDSAEYDFIYIKRSSLTVEDKLDIVRGILVVLGKHWGNLLSQPCRLHYLSRKCDHGLLAIDCGDPDIGFRFCQ